MGATITSWKKKHISTEQQFHVLPWDILTEANGLMIFTTAKSSPLAKVIPNFMNPDYFFKRKRKLKCVLPKSIPKHLYIYLWLMRKIQLGKIQ